MNAIAEAIEDNRMRRLIVGNQPVTIEERLTRLEAIVGCAITTEAAGAKAVMLRRQHIIRSLAAEVYGLTLEKVMRTGRSHKVVWARFTGMYLMRLLLPMTLDEIATAYNHRDHGTACHGIGELTDRMSVDPDYAREINELTLRVKKEIEL